MTCLVLKSLPSPTPSPFPSVAACLRPFCLMEQKGTDDYRQRPSVRQRILVRSNGAENLLFHSAAVTVILGNSFFRKIMSYIYILDPVRSHKTAGPALFSV